MDTNNKLRVQIEDATEIDAIADMWQGLEPDCERSFFQSWGWIGTWLKSLPAGMRPQLISARAADKIVGLAVLIPQRVQRHRIFFSDALFLNETGVAKYNFVVEHNGFLLKSGDEAEILTQCLRALVAAPRRWDELFISAVRTDNPLFRTPILKELGLRLQTLKTSTSRYVDLAELRLNNQDYLATLSSNTRYQIRRALRKYTEIGPVELHVATTLEQAQHYFDNLKELHQAYWVGKGRPGSFANPVWEQFHRRLIDTRYAHAEIQMIRLSAGETDIGYLYIFVKNGWVYALQSGFRYDTPPATARDGGSTGNAGAISSATARDGGSTGGRPLEANAGAISSALHPGYVSHYLAIEYNLKHGTGVYDFLAGDAQYKSSLSHKDHTLAWVVVQRKRWKFILEDALRSLVYAMRERTSA